MRLIRRRPQLEEIAVGAAESFAARQFRLKRFPFLWHRHPEVELTLIVKGRGMRYIGDSVEPFADGDLCLLGPDLPHSWSSDPADGRVHSVVIQFLPALWGDRLLQLPELRAARLLLERAGTGLMLRPGRERRRAADQLRRLVETPVGSPKRLLGLLDLLAGLGHARAWRPICLHPFDPAPAAGGDAMFHRILRRLHEDLADAPSEAEMAAACDLSPSAFSRLFKRHMGKNYARYVNDMRIARVCEGLAHTQESITTLAFAAGFRNLSNFNRRFHAAIRLTPRQYRALWR